MSYHIRDIPRGEFGKASKIVEESHEFVDAVEQGCVVMALQELSDMVGAIQGYLDECFPGTHVYDLYVMSEITKRAFESGHRTPRKD